MMELNNYCSCLNLHHITCISFTASFKYLYFYIFLNFSPIFKKILANSLVHQNLQFELIYSFVCVFILQSYYLAPALKVLKVHNNKALHYLRRCYVDTTMEELSGQFCSIVECLQATHLNHKKISKETHNVE